MFRISSRPGAWLVVHLATRTCTTFNLTRTISGPAPVPLSIRPTGFQVVKDDHDHDGPDNHVLLTDQQQQLELGKWYHARVEISGPRMTPNGRRAVSGSWDNTLRVWDLDSGQCLAVYHAGVFLQSLAVSPAGDRIVCGTKEAQVHSLTPVNFPPAGPP